MAEAALVLCLVQQHGTQLRKLYLEALIALETVADEDRLRRNLIQGEAGGVQLLHLIQKLHCNVTNLVLGKRAFKIGEHV